MYLTVFPVLGGSCTWFFMYFVVLYEIADSFMYRVVFYVLGFSSTWFFMYSGVFPVLGGFSSTWWFSMYLTVLSLYPSSLPPSLGFTLS